MKFAPALVTVLFAANGFSGICQQSSASSCDNPKTTIEMRECAALKLKNSEKELEQVYSFILSKLPDQAHKKLFALSQEAWRNYRDTEVKFEGNFYNGGTVQVQIQLDCMTRMTLARTKELRQILEDEFSH